MRKTIRVDSIIKAAVLERKRGDEFQNQGSTAYARICYARASAMIAVISLGFDDNKFNMQWEEVYSMVWKD